MLLTEKKHQCNNNNNNNNNIGHSLRKACLTNNNEPFLEMETLAVTHLKQ